MVMVAPRQKSEGRGVVRIVIKYGKVEFKGLPIVKRFLNQVAYNSGSGEYMSLQ